MWGYRIVFYQFVTTRYTTDFCIPLTLVVSTVFLRHRKTGFELPVSFFVYPLQRKTEFEIPFSFFVFRFPFSYYIENRIPTLVFAFRFPTTLESRILVSIPFSVFLFCKILKIEIWTSIFVFHFWVFVTFFFILPVPEECWHFLSLTIDQLETTSLMKYFRLCPPFSYWRK